jgi:hypothetical protein
MVTKGGARDGLFLKMKAGLYSVGQTWKTSRRGILPTFRVLITGLLPESDRPGTHIQDRAG